MVAGATPLLGKVKLVADTNPLKVALDVELIAVVNEIAVRKVGVALIVNVSPAAFPIVVLPSTVRLPVRVILPVSASLTTASRFPIIETSPSLSTVNKFVPALFCTASTTAVRSEE